MQSYGQKAPTDPSIKNNEKAEKRKLKILNKAPADRQITAEQILREAYEHRLDEVKQKVFKISNLQELKEYQLLKRIEFEENLRRQPHSINCWLRYAKWEESQKEWERVRSIYERALTIDYKNRSIWLKYSEFEMKNKFPNHARNVWDRAVQLLPRTDQFWYKYALMEERLGNIDKAKTIFERWMKWNPSDSAWESYIKLEMRCAGKKTIKVERARKIWKRFVLAREELSPYLKWAKFESKFGTVEKTRNVYTMALTELGEEAHKIEFFTSFANFEKDVKEIERARAIYKFALDNVAKYKAEELFRSYTQFEKQNGARKNIDLLVKNNKRFIYEEKLKQNPTNYDIWFDYINLSESTKNHAETIDLYERAIAVIPPLEQKTYWSRYIFLWLRYALFCETATKDYERTREIFRQCLNLVPQKKFTFSKIWIAFAKFEIRRMNLKAARKVFGLGIGLCKKMSLLKGYIELETKLLQMDRCRKLYEKMLELFPENCDAWQNYAQMESALGENERSRAIFELGIGQDFLDMPERLWTKFIDFEYQLGNKDKVIELFERLLERTKNLKVWISYSETLSNLNEFVSARKVFERADEYFKSEGFNSNESRNEILNKWLEFEKKVGSEENIKNVQKKLPKEVQKRKKIEDEEGNQIGVSDYVEYVFPDVSDGKEVHLNLLNLAHKWKKNIKKSN